MQAPELQMLIPTLLGAAELTVPQGHGGGPSALGLGVRRPWPGHHMAAEPLADALPLSWPKGSVRGKGGGEENYSILGETWEVAQDSLISQERKRKGSSLLTTQNARGVRLRLVVFFSGLRWPFRPFTLR